MSKFWDLLLDYLKRKPYWTALEPFVVVGFGWAFAQVIAYEVLAASYPVRPDVRLFLRSYVAKRITIGAVGLMLLIVVFQRRPDGGASTRLRAYIAEHRRLILYRTVAVLAVAALVVTGLLYYSPHRVSHITVRFMDLGADVRADGLAYLVYELNRRQPHWYFDVDLTPFTEEMLTSSEARRCAEDARPKLCHAEGLANGRPFIGITAQPLGGAFFAEHRGSVSVISTSDRAAYHPLSSYEYLVYCLILQSIAIHLDVQGGGLPADSFHEQRSSHGGLLQFIPERSIVKSSMLAARLTPEEESLLLNRFGPAYVATCADLLTMNWLYSDRVRSNLEHAFGTKLLR